MVQRLQDPHPLHAHYTHAPYPGRASLSAEQCFSSQHVSNNANDNVHHADNVAFAHLASHGPSLIPQSAQLGMGNFLHALSHGVMPSGGVTILHMPNPTSATLGAKWGAFANPQAYAPHAHVTGQAQQLPYPLPILTHTPLACSNGSFPSNDNANNHPMLAELPLPYPGAVPASIMPPGTSVPVATNHTFPKDPMSSQVPVRHVDGFEHWSPTGIDCCVMTTHDEDPTAAPIPSRKRPR